MGLYQFGQNLATVSKINADKIFFRVIGSEIAEDYPDYVDAVQMLLKSQLIRVHIVSCGL